MNSSFDSSDPPIYQVECCPIPKQIPSTGQAGLISIFRAGGSYQWTDDTDDLLGLEISHVDTENMEEGSMTQRPDISPLCTEKYTVNQQQMQPSTISCLAFFL